MKEGSFCELIGLGSDRRLCLTIENGKLQRLLDSPLKQILHHSPGISLAVVLQNYHLSPKMKATLAYILAHAAWQFYDSDWMETPWTADTIQFILQHASTDCSEGPKAFASKPYLSISFGQNSAISELSSGREQNHHFPRVRDIGILLVEIGRGTSILCSEEESRNEMQRNNKRWILAKQYSDSEDPWPNFDYANYRTAVKSCIDPEIFSKLTRDPNMNTKTPSENVQERRRIFYEKVVFPLHELVRGTGWKDELTHLHPWQLSEKYHDERHTFDAEEIQASGKGNLEEQKRSRSWLKQIRQLNDELSTVTRSPYPGRRIRVAILDTGYDADATFFQPPSRRNRLRKWKDWVENSESPQDSDGHGTHLVSLIMKIAPQADIYVSRVAKSPKSLYGSAEKVAQVSIWLDSISRCSTTNRGFRLSNGPDPNGRLISSQCHLASKTTNPLLTELYITV